MNLRRVIFLPLLACLALGVAACGDDNDDSGGGSGDAPTREEFAKEANKICSDLQAQGDKLENPKTVEDVQKFTDQAASAIDDAVKKLAALEVPEGEDGEKAEAFVNGVEKDTEEKIKPALEGLADAAETKDQQKILAAAQKVSRVNTDATDKLARELGAASCAE